MNWYAITSIVSSIILASIAIIMVYKIIIRNNKIKYYSGMVDSLYEKSAKDSKEITKWKNHTLELENNIEKSFGLKVRNEITVVESDFTKMEMVTIYAGIDKLRCTNDSLDDAKVYITLLDKIQKLLDDMKEEE